MASSNPFHMSPNKRDEAPRTPVGGFRIPGYDQNSGHPQSSTTIVPSFHTPLRGMPVYTHVQNGSPVELPATPDPNVGRQAPPLIQYPTIDQARQYNLDAMVAMLDRIQRLSSECQSLRAQVDSLNARNYMLEAELGRRDAAAVPELTRQMANFGRN